MNICDNNLMHMHEALTTFGSEKDANLPAATYALIELSDPYRILPSRVGIKSRRYNGFEKQYSR